MGVDLLAILLLEAENHLDGWEIRGVVALRPNQLLICGDGQLRGIFELFRSASSIQRTRRVIGENVRIWRGLAKLTI